MRIAAIAIEMAFVLDASIAIAWLLPDEGSKATDALVERLITDTAFVPAIWPLEVINALFVAARRGRIPRTRIETLAEELIVYPITVESASLKSCYIPAKLAARYKLTVYDASYLELAQRRQLPLATLDNRLREACTKLNITTLPE
ncbi:MAG TPA: type II toxin-antitoxin system VapC family toxin [Gammaproteobacteria bacterium]|nr:type II toxin-antitoxin system VapC family toxin [Gammaproteobacteria bacterium]